MKHHLTKAAALALAAVLMTGSASALFGKKADETPPEGAPQVWDLEIRTYRDIPSQGEFLASDPEGDEMTFTLAEEPRKGTVVIEGGGFTYTPDEGITGSDRFTYTATDSQGHTSAPAKVSVTIDKTRSGVTYSDTEGSPAARAAQTLAEKGVFTGGKIGDLYYFQPDQPVVDEDRTSELHVVNKSRVGNGYPCMVSLYLLCRQGKCPACLKGHFLSFLQYACTNLRTLRIQEDRNRHLLLLAQRLDHIHAHLLLLMSPVGEIESGNIHAVLYKLSHNLRIVSPRSHRTYNLCFFHLSKPHSLIYFTFL